MRWIEPFAPIALIPAMMLGLPLKIPEEISPLLRENIPTIQERFQGLDVSISGTRVSALPGSPRTPDSGRGVGLFFSGGVDSFHLPFDRLHEIRFPKCNGQ